MIGIVSWFFQLWSMWWQQYYCRIIHLGGVLFLLFKLMTLLVPSPKCTIVLESCLTVELTLIYSVHLLPSYVNPLISLVYFWINDFLFPCWCLPWFSPSSPGKLLKPDILFSAFPNRSFAQFYWASHFCSLVWASRLPSTFPASPTTSTAILRCLSAV